jgi:hypothetical protein
MTEENCEKNLPLSGVIPPEYYDLDELDPKDEDYELICRFTENGFSKEEIHKILAEQIHYKSRDDNTTYNVQKPIVGYYNLAQVDKKRNEIVDRYNLDELDEEDEDYDIKYRFTSSGYSKKEIDEMIVKNYYYKK